MIKIQPFRLYIEAIRLLLHHRRPALSMIIPWALAYWALNLLGNVMTKDGSWVEFLTVIIIQTAISLGGLAFMPYVIIRWSQILSRSANPSSFRELRRYALWTLWAIVKVTIAIVIPVAALILFIEAIGKYFSSITSSGGVSLFAYTIIAKIAFLFPLSRLLPSIVMPAVGSTTARGLRTAWSLTRGNGLRISLGLLAVVVTDIAIRYPILVLIIMPTGLLDTESSLTEIEVNTAIYLVTTSFIITLISVMFNASVWPIYMWLITRELRVGSDRSDPTAASPQRDLAARCGDPPVHPA